MDKYVRAQERIADNLWSVDPEMGQVYNDRGRPIGSRTHLGYVFLTMSPAAGGRSNQNCYAHRVIWESVHGPIADGLQVNHINGIKTDNRIANLEVVTASGNMQHAFRTGLNTGRPGATHPMARLTAADVAVIKRRVADGERQYVVAADFGVSRAQVSRIVTGKGWREASLPAA